MRYTPAIAALLGFAAFGYAADRVVGGPYVVNATGRSATVAWIVQTDEFKVGDSPESLKQTIPVLRCEKVSLSGLKPGTTVHYEAGHGAGRGYFKTPPAGAAPFQFVVFGDTRTRHEMHQRVVNAMAASNPDFVMHTGDLVSDGYDLAQWPTFFGIERELLRKTVFFPVLGNHERNNARFHEFFDVKSPYYSFDWGNAHFILMNSDVANVTKSPAQREAYWKEQVRWLEEDLAQSQKADFRFVVLHHPPYTVNTEKAGHVSKLTPQLTPLFEKYKVAAVFGGHDHNYQHHLKNGIRYIVTGGGGAPLANTGTPLEGMTKKVESAEHFVTVKVDGKRATIRALALDGRAIDEIELQ